MKLVSLLAFLLVLTGIRLVLAAHVELSPDESYFFLWAKHPNISYHNAGPGIALAILAGTKLFGANELGVRFLSPVLGLATSLFVYLLAKKLYSDRVAFWSTLLLNLTPIFNIGSILITIDSLAIFFWSAALYCFLLALERSPKSSFYWPLTGVLIGLGFLCSYTNALQLLLIGCFLLAVPKFRGEVRKPGFYVLLICFLPALIPPVIWNQEHEWITLASWAASRSWNEYLRFRMTDLGASFGSLLTVYSPLVMIGLLIALFGSIRKSFRNSRTCLLLTFSWPILLYTVFAAPNPGRPILTAPAFVSLAILASQWWMQISRDRPWLTGLCFCSMASGGLLTVMMTNTDVVRELGMNLSYQFDPSARLRGWRSLAEKVESFRTDFEQKLGSKVFLIGDDYQMASSLSFYLKEKRTEGPWHPPVYIPESQDIENEFSFWPRYDEFVETSSPRASNSYFTEEAGINPFIDRSALYITDRPEGEAPQNLRSAFTRCELVAVLELNRRSQFLREVRIFACYQYQTLPL